MSVADLFAAASWAGSAPSNRDQVDWAPARNTVCIRTLLRRERIVGNDEEAEVIGVFDPLLAPATTDEFVGQSVVVDVPDRFRHTVSPRL